MNYGIQNVKGVGPKRALAFKNTGIEKIKDLIEYYPRRYIMRTNIVPIKDLLKYSVEGGGKNIFLIKS